ncbi:TorF family putative porin [Paucibacter sp. O1-1]|nr:TorF family putative porin [Paucibacter sp. O1-1]MDA3827884.1 TorF family putative porin [Paucibacter sp. O1-1]
MITAFVVYHKQQAILHCKPTLTGATIAAFLWVLGAVMSTLMNQVITLPDVEIDVYAGYYGEINDDTSYDFTLYRYNYPGDSELDYLEVSVGIDYSGFRAAYWYTDDYGGSDLDLHYTEINYSWEFVEDWSLDLHYGYNFGDAIDDGEGFDSYSDFSIGVSTEFSGFSVSMAYLDTDIDGDYEVNSGVYKNSGTLLATVSYAF